MGNTPLRRAKKLWRELRTSVEPVHSFSDLQSRKFFADKEEFGTLKLLLHAHGYVVRRAHRVWQRDGVPDVHLDCVFSDWRHKEFEAWWRQATMRIEEEIEVSRVLRRYRMRAAPPVDTDPSSPHGLG
jgi:hypothetical protein